MPQASVIFRSHSFNNLSIPERVARFDEAEASLLIKYIGKTNVWVTSVSRSKRAKPLLVLKVEQIESVFKATSKQKAWDHFSKAQRKNLDLWRKQAKVSSLLCFLLGSSTFVAVFVAVLLVLLLLRLCYLSCVFPCFLAWYRTDIQSMVAIN